MKKWSSAGDIKGTWVQGKPQEISTSLSGQAHAQKAFVAKKQKEQGGALRSHRRFSV